MPPTGFDANHKHGFTIVPSRTRQLQDSVNVLDLVIDALPDSVMRTDLPDP